MMSKFVDMTSSFSYFSKFHANIITGSEVLIIFFYKGLTRNPENANTPVWVFSDIWRLGQVRDIKFGTNVSNKMLLNAAKCQGYRVFELLMENQQGVKLPLINSITRD